MSPTTGSDWIGRWQALAEVRETCLHSDTQHGAMRCPTCYGILRRCCDSVIGMFPHRPGCVEEHRVYESAVLYAALVNEAEENG